jgi:hypothetical protein
MPSPKTTTKPKRKPAKKTAPRPDRYRVTVDLDTPVYDELVAKAETEKTRHTDYIRKLIDHDLHGTGITIVLPEEVAEALASSAAEDFKEVNTLVREVLVASLRARGAL